MRTPFSLNRPAVKSAAFLTALLFAQQSFAVGTDAGTEISNQATVTYSVNSEVQAPVDSTVATFVVDRIVTFEVQEQDTVFATVEPSGTGVTYFRVTNTSNSPLDFALVADNLADGVDVNGNVDNADMVTPFEVRVAAPGVDTAGTPPASGAPVFVDALAEGEFVDVYVFADAPGAVVDGEFANVFLEATAHDPDDGVSTVNPGPDGNLGAVLVEAANTDAGIENVFNDAGNDGVETAQWGFEHSSATLDITKTAVVESDPFGSGLAIPGATIEYTIAIVNNGSADATAISISDDVDADVDFVTDAYDGGASNIRFVNGATTTFCLADGTDSNQDGCTFDGTTLTIEGLDQSTAPVSTDIDVAAGETLQISFRVFIPDTP